MISSRRVRIFDSARESLVLERKGLGVADDYLSRDPERREVRPCKLDVARREVNRGSPFCPALA